jgi:hypothetical protein
MLLQAVTFGAVVVVAAGILVIAMRVQRSR